MIVAKYYTAVRYVFYLQSYEVILLYQSTYSSRFCLLSLLTQVVMYDLNYFYSF